MSKTHKILISGGGTGGHIFPALSIADAIRRLSPDSRILFVGAEGRMEMERVPAAGYDIEGLPVAGFDRRRLWRNFGVLLKLWRSMRKARHILDTFKPDVAVGVGGYASGPMLKAAQSRHIPTLIQEQNSYPGVTNKLLASHAAYICVAYPGMERYFDATRLVLTGNPVRHGLSESILTQEQAKAEYGFDPDAPLVLIVGGSLGARTINQSVTAALDRWHDEGISVIWQCGKLYQDTILPIASRYDNVRASAFITDMATAYRAADLVVSRAGAGTISELELLGKASVLIPSPNVAEDHQRHNAEALTTRDAAVMLTDDEAPAALGEMVSDLLADPLRLDKLGAGAKLLAQQDSAERVARLVLELADKSDINT